MLIVWSVISIFAVWLYLGLIVFILKNWLSQEEYIPGLDSIQLSEISVSILIASRNEGDKLFKCLQSLKQCGEIVKQVSQIIIVDDFSEDNSFTLIDDLDLPQLIKVHMHDYLDDSKLSSKKKALAQGLKFINSDYVIQLDADVSMRPSYLNAILGFISQHKPDFLAAPVCLTGEETIFDNFQNMDFMGMMGVTQAGIKSGNWYMANGANMIYRRDDIQFSDDGFASGDDVFAIQQAISNNGVVNFLKSKDAIVNTSSCVDLKSFYDQRIRWATKNRYMKSWKMKLMMAIPFICSITLFFLVIGFLFFDKTIFSLLIVHHLFVCLSINYIYLKELSSFFKKTIHPLQFMISQVLHFAYILIFGSLSLLVTNYNWKGRKLK